MYVFVILFKVFFDITLSFKSFVTIVTHKQKWLHYLLYSCKEICFLVGMLFCRKYLLFLFKSSTICRIVRDLRLPRSPLFPCLGSWKLSFIFNCRWLWIKEDESVSKLLQKSMWCLRI